jgi:hypothetical protein
MIENVKTLHGVGDIIHRPTRQIEIHKHSPDWSTATSPDKNGVVRVRCACGYHGRMKVDVLWGSDRDNGVVADVGA